MEAWRSALASICLAAGLATAVSCASSPPTRFYVLSPVASAEKDGVKNAGNRGIAAGLRRVTLPDYLDRTQIITRVSPTKVNLAEFDRWAAPLSDAFTTTLAEDLAVAIPTNRVAVFPWARATAIDYEITVDVMSFEGTLGGNCILVARWSISDRRGKEPPLTGRSSLTEPAGDTYEALVAAHSRLVAALSREIAAALEQVSTTGTRAQGR